MHPSPSTDDGIARQDGCPAGLGAPALRTSDSAAQAGHPAQRVGLALPTPQALMAPQAPIAPAAADTALWTALLGGPALDAVDAQALADLARPRQVAAGEAVFSRSQPAQALVALQHGAVALGRLAADGQLQVDSMAQGPAWLDVSAAWLGLPFAMDARAQGPAVVLEWPCAALVQRLPRCPGLAQRLIQSLARQVQALAAQQHALMHLDAPARLAAWLQQHSEPLPAGPSGQAVVKLQQRKRDLAAQLAITPETLSRLMRSFSVQGVIDVAGYQVRVLDPAALASLARG